MYVWITNLNLGCVLFGFFVLFFVFWLLFLVQSFKTQVLVNDFAGYNFQELFSKAKMNLCLFYHNQNRKKKIWIVIPKLYSAVIINPSCEHKNIVLYLYITEHLLFIKNYLKFLSHKLKSMNKSRSYFTKHISQRIISVFHLTLTCQIL